MTTDADRRRALEARDKFLAYLTPEIKTMVNRTPVLQSLLYDLDLLPEQLLSQEEITPGLIDAFFQFGTIIEHFRAALAEREWMPIESAPKDGMPILVIGGEIEPEIGKTYPVQEAVKVFWNTNSQMGEGGIWSVSDVCQYEIRISNPVYWQKLPSVQQQNSGGSYGCSSSPSEGMEPSSNAGSPESRPDAALETVDELEITIEAAIQSLKENDNDVMCRISGFVLLGLIKAAKLQLKRQQGE